MLESLIAEFESIDLIAGIANANKEFNRLFTEDKNSYTKEEIMQTTKGSNGAFFEWDFEALIMQDYQNTDGTFQREGVMLMYGLKSGALRNAESPYTIRRESKEEPKSPNNAKEKTLEEKAKELKDALDDYYRKALEYSRQNEHKERENFILSDIEDRTNRLEIEKAMEKEVEKLKNDSVGGEWIKVGFI